MSTISTPSVEPTPKTKKKIKPVQASGLEAADDTGVIKAISRDIRLGRVTGKLTFGTVKAGYGLKVDSRIRKVFAKMESQGILTKKGKSYYVENLPVLRSVSG